MTAKLLAYYQTDSKMLSSEFQNVSIQKEKTKVKF